MLQNVWRYVLVIRVGAAVLYGFNRSFDVEEAELASPRAGKVRVRRGPR